MVQFIAEQNVLFYAMAAVGVLGAISQVLLYSFYVRLLRDMEHTGAPRGKFMKQLRQKFGGYQRMNEGMSNVSVFVKKSLMEYRKLGMNLHQWRRLGAAAFFLCAAMGIGAYITLGIYGYAGAVRQNYLWAVAVCGLFLAGVYGLTDIGYKRKYLMTGLENLLCNTGIPRNYHVEDQQAFRTGAEAKAASLAGGVSAAESVNPPSGVQKAKGLSKRKRAKAAATQAQKDKLELKENLARLKEGISESAASADGERERKAQILKQMDPEEQERIIREVLKEFLS